jgi:hypothetical protein
MYGHLKISTNEHSGKLRPHEHTSYLPLAILIFIVGLLLALFSLKPNANAATPYTGPEAGSIGLTGAMPAKPPQTAATITKPGNGQHFSSTPITVSGTCPKDTLWRYIRMIFLPVQHHVKQRRIFSRDRFLFGQNSLKAQVYDVLNQAGPESNTVTVFYDVSFPVAAPTSFFDFSGAQLILIHRRCLPRELSGTALNVPITIIGGTPPVCNKYRVGGFN